MSNSNNHTSWIEIDPSSDFSLSNIPFGVCSKPPTHPTPRCCTILGQTILDLSVLSEAGLFRDVTPSFDAASAFCQPALNEFMRQPKTVWVQVRNRIQDLFRLGGSEDLRNNPALLQCAILTSAYTSEEDNDGIIMHLPAVIGDYTDFYSSKYHATNVGIMFRGKDNALQPNWLHLPVAYHGRASSVYVSGTNVVRPHGQLQIDPTDPNKGSTYGACRLMDFELEMGLFVGGPNNNNHHHQPLTMENVQERMFGLVLMNDWSARDVQKWEYVPLGPFGSKNFATSISPWIVTIMALEAFQCAPTDAENVQVDPQPLEYLRDSCLKQPGGMYDIHLSVDLCGKDMPKKSHSATITKSNLRHLYWSPKQQLVHHAVTGCPMHAGDLLGTGTISGPTQQSLGCLLELSWKGTREVVLALGEKNDAGEGRVRKFLQDGDTVVLKGYCEANGESGRVGFGTCSGTLLPAGTATPSTTPTSPLLSTPSAPVPTPTYTHVKLYSYWMSSATWRVRIALAAKNINYEYIPVHLLKGEQKEREYEERNAMLQVPVLECQRVGDSGQEAEVVRLAQSVAILEFLDEHPFISSPNSSSASSSDNSGSASASLYPKDPLQRAHVREVVEIINSGIQPLQNLSFLKQIEQESNGTISFQQKGCQVITKGLAALEKMQTQAQTQSQSQAPSRGPYLCGSFAPTAADMCLIPQLFNARRFGVNVTMFPKLLEVEKVCVEHEWFVGAHPFCQPDVDREVMEKIKAMMMKGG